MNQESENIVRLDDSANIEVILSPAPLKKGQAGVAWIVIILLVVGTVSLQAARSEKNANAGPDGEGRLGLMLVQMQGRCWIGLANLDSSSATRLYQQAQGLNTGPLGQRLRFVILAGELVGPKEALGQLKNLQDKLTAQAVHLTPEQQGLLAALNRLYTDYDQHDLGAPSLNLPERTLLHQHLGWFGDLALAPAGAPDGESRQAVLQPAFRTAFTFMGLGVGIGILSVGGMAGLMVLLSFLILGKLRGALGKRLGYGGIYAETFAVWMLLFLGLNLATTLLPESRPRLLLSGSAMLLSLAALAWPIIRGIPWNQVRHDIGLTAGKLGALEPAFGFATYAMALPLLGIGLILTMVLMHLQGGLATGAGPDDFNQAGSPAHPIVGIVAGADWWVAFQVLLLAAVIAPVVEEIMFRGVLYRHLRETTSRLGSALSVLISGLVVSFIFAVIHPQGLVAVPALMALAFAFALAREWRGTLIPSMIAHGINNGLLLGLVLIVMSN